jgi:hypothetical protein
MFSHDFPDDDLLKREIIRELSPCGVIIEFSNQPSLTQRGFHSHPSDSGR